MNGGALVGMLSHLTRNAPLSSILGTLRALKELL